MSTFRLGVLVAAIAMLAAVAAPGRAVSASVTNERSLRAGFHLGNPANPTELAIAATAAVGATTARACVTVDPAGSAPAQTFCGPATVDIDPTLQSARANGVINGITFALRFTAATAAPSVSSSATSSAASSVTLPSPSLSVTQTGTAVVTAVGGLLGTAVTQGSSWYAEVKDKVTTASTTTA